MTRTRIPDDVLSAAHARATARAAHDWPEADRLRAVIEDAGWTVVDRGTDFALRPAAPLDVVEPTRVRYGASRNVPSRTASPSVGLATIVLMATDGPDALARTLDGLRAHAPDGTSVVIVADDPSDDQARALHEIGDAATEIVWTSERLGRAPALNVGSRRAPGPVIIALATAVEPAGDFVTPLVLALEDPTVAVAGRWGMRTTDLRTFTDVPVGEVDVIDGDLVAFRRDDYGARGPLDERFRTDRWLDAWWSLVLRDEGEGSRPRRAVALGDLPAVRHAPTVVLPAPDADRSAKRDFYRMFDRFGSRRDLRGSGA